MGFLRVFTYHCRLVTLLGSLGKSPSSLILTTNSLRWRRERRGNSRRKLGAITVPADWPAGEKEERLVGEAGEGSVGARIQGERSAQWVKLIKVGLAWEGSGKCVQREMCKDGSERKKCGFSVGVWRAMTAAAATWGRGHPRQVTRGGRYVGNTCVKKEGKDSGKAY